MEVIAWSGALDKMIVHRMVIPEEFEREIVQWLEKIGNLRRDPSFVNHPSRFAGIPYTTSKYLPPSVLAVVFNRAGDIIKIIMKDEENVEAQGKE